MRDQGWKLSEDYCGSWCISDTGEARKLNYFSELDILGRVHINIASQLRIGKCRRVARKRFLATKAGYCCISLNFTKPIVLPLGAFQAVKPRILKQDLQHSEYTQEWGRLSLSQGHVNGSSLVKLSGSEATLRLIYLQSKINTSARPFWYLYVLLQIKS
jgi:hypothetical protein